MKSQVLHELLVIMSMVLAVIKKRCVLNTDHWKTDVKSNKMIIIPRPWGNHKGKCMYILWTHQNTHIGVAAVTFTKKIGTKEGVCG